MDSQTSKDPTKEESHLVHELQHDSENPVVKYQTKMVRWKNTVMYNVVVLQDDYHKCN